MFLLIILAVLLFFISLTYILYRLITEHIDAKFIHLQQLIDEAKSKNT